MSIQNRRGKFPFFLGVFILCMSVLMIQIIQTRILSVVSMYYMAFFSISMAMLGLTGGALIVYFKMSNVNPNNVSAVLSRTSTAFSLCIAVCFVLQLSSPLLTVKWATFGVIWLKAIILLAMPFVFGGIAVCLALTRSTFAVGLIYGMDLLGAATGCIFTLAVLTWMDAPSAMFMVAALAAAAAWCFARANSEAGSDCLGAQLAYPQETWCGCHRAGRARLWERCDQSGATAYLRQVWGDRKAQRIRLPQVELVLPRSRQELGSPVSHFSGARRRSCRAAP